MKSLFYLKIPVLTLTLLKAIGFGFNLHHDTKFHCKKGERCQLLSSTKAFASLKDKNTNIDGPLLLNEKNQIEETKDLRKIYKSISKKVSTITLMLSFAIVLTSNFANASDDAVSRTKKYDGFAEYAKENQMAQSDISCFINKCSAETRNLFSNPRGIKGISCLGRCKGEQSCSTRCFAEFSSEALNSWLSCTIEENECVKVPKNLDNSAEDVGYDTAISPFDPTTLVGTWYKTYGLNPNYDLFDCQTNVFRQAAPDKYDMDIFLRINNPPTSGGGYWENALNEQMTIDTNPKSSRTMSTEGKMYGLSFYENWYIIGQALEGNKENIPPYILVAFKGHTLQGNYEGSFVYSKTPTLSKEAIPFVTADAKRAGLDFTQYKVIDNTCPTDRPPLNDNEAGTGTSTTDWVNLAIGEGGVVDWVFPGWRGEYKK